MQRNVILPSNDFAIFCDDVVDNFNQNSGFPVSKIMTQASLTMAAKFDAFVQSNKALSINQPEASEYNKIIENAVQRLN